MIKIIRQIRFALGDIRANLAQTIIFFVQMFVTIIILCYIVQLGIDTRLSIEKLQSLVSESNIYMLYDDSESYDFDFIINNPSAQQRQVELYHYINNLENIETYTVSRSNKFYMYGNPKSLPKKVMAGNTAYEIKINRIEVSPNFFQTFNIDGDFEREEIQKSFKSYSEKRQIPIILGNTFKKFYSKGEVILNAKGEEYVIVGFLNKNSYYVAPQDIKSFIYLDNYFITPVMVNTQEALQVTNYIFNTNFKTNDITKIQNIIDKGNSLDLYPMHYGNFKKQLKELIVDAIDEAMTMGAIAIIVGIFASIGMIGWLLQVISDYSKEFAIHILCGAEEKNIIFRISIQIGIPFILSVITLFCLFGITRASIITSAIGVIYIASVLVYPISTICRQPLIEIIRRNAK